MKGSLVFMADLIRRIPLDLTVHLVRVTSQREQAAGRVLTEIVYSTAVPLEGRDVLLVDDIVDTGITLSYLLAHIHEHGPREPARRAPSSTSPRPARSTCTRTGRPSRSTSPLADRFLVGYGLDWMERYRGLPFIGTIPRPGAALKPAPRG